MIGSHLMTYINLFKSLEKPIIKWYELTIKPPEKELSLFATGPLDFENNKN
jgi:hypothetical protein